MPIGNQARSSFKGPWKCCPFRMMSGNIREHLPRAMGKPVPTHSPPAADSPTSCHRAHRTPTNGVLRAWLCHLVPGVERRTRASAERVKNMCALGMDHVQGSRSIAVLLFPTGLDHLQTGATISSTYTSVTSRRSLPFLTLRQCFQQEIRSLLRYNAGSYTYSIIYSLIFDLSHRSSTSSCLPILIHHGALVAVLVV
jgi:hypothetical protein